LKARFSAKLNILIAGVSKTNRQQFPTLQALKFQWRQLFRFILVVKQVFQVVTWE
jgi:hypothetical protein